MSNHSEIRESFEKWAAANNHHTEEYMFAAWEAGRESERAALRELVIKVAKDVGGQFWETHMLNTGLLKLLALIPSEKEAKNGAD